MALALIVSLLLFIAFQLMRLNEQITDLRIESLPPDENDLWQFFLEMMEDDEAAIQETYNQDDEDDF